MAACIAGTLDLELVNVAGVNSASHPIAKCYNSMTVTVTDTCTLSVTANGQDNYVPAIYSADPTYSQVGGCPAGGTTIVYTDDATITDADNVATLIATSIYATGLTATAAVEAGIVTITSSGATLKFRPSSKTGTSEAGIFAAGAPSCSVATECAAPLVGKMPVCDAGRYPVSIADTTTFVCAFCAAGTTSVAGTADAAEAETCTRCAAGTAAPVVGTTGATACSACLAGTFSTLGSSDCRPCAPGTYQNAGSASSCKSCPTTWSSHTYGATGCIKCTHGRPAICTADCSDTTAGSAGAFTALMDGSTLFGASGDTLNSYSYPALLKTCSPISTLVAFAVDETCAIEIHALAVTTTTTNGKACSDPSNVESAVMAYYTDAATIMTLVPDNVAVSNIVKIVKASDTTVTMSVIAVARDPSTLPAAISGVLTVNGGALVGTTVTTTCPVGTYLQGSLETLTCPACDPGFYCPATATSPTECTPGTYSTMGQGTCTAADTDCVEGQQFNPETNGCECAPGYKSLGEGNCEICPANTISAGGSVTECTACDGATPYSALGSETCGVCPAGEAENVSGVCTRCAAGEEPNSDSTACVACSAGYYNPSGDGGSEFDTCQKCAGGTAVNGEKTACVTCDVGTASPNGVACNTCPAGGYAPAGANRCTPCAGGSQQSAEKTACTKCAAGTHREGFSSAGCVACDDGSAARIGSDTCTRCMPGTYATGQVAACTPCPVNTYAVDYGTTVCAACPSGTSTLGETGATECSRCPAGTKLVGDTCEDCPLGEFQNRAGQRTCKKCPIGKFSDVLGSETCELCPGGRYNSITGSSTCRACPSGTFSPGGKGSCSICPRGRYSAPGATACTTCTAGYYANKLGSRSCTACPAGSRCPGRGSTGPTLCAAGSFQSKPAQTTCTPCPKKTFSDKAGASKCAACSSATTVGSKTCARRRMLLGRFDTATL